MAVVNLDLHQKFRNLKKLPLTTSVDGTSAIVEAREDEEQIVKLQEIIDLLVAAGYFRARIKGLSPFDKIVGGMTWCIESCNIDVDVDLLFQENSTIGQKIALTEKIVAVLPKMKCPHQIEPHQIQGLDFVHIFPVIQWLVKRSMEFRQEMSDFVRSYAVCQFNKTFSSESTSEIQKQILENVQIVRDTYKPRRYYKRKTWPPEDIETRIQLTLLEYGMKGDVSSGKIAQDGSLVDQHPEFDVQKLLMSMAEMKQDENEFTLSEDNRIALNTHYQSLQSELEDGGIRSQKEKRVLAAKVQERILAKKSDKLKERLTTLDALIGEKQEALAEIKDKEEEVDKVLAQLKMKEVENLEELKEVEELVLLNDNLKAQEMQFKNHCKQELATLEKLIEEAKHSKPPDEVGEGLNEELQKETEIMKTLRLQLAKKNRLVATLQRKLDEVPNTAELAQYQRRFLELYNQVAAKHKETKQYYTLYNTLEDTRMYMKKELSLLNSICDNYPEAISSASGKDEFLKQFENIVEGVKQSRTKLEHRLFEEKHKRDRLAYTLQSLVEQQRRYVTAVRELTIEFRKYESLVSQQNV